MIHEAISSSGNQKYKHLIYNTSVDFMYWNSKSIFIRHTRINKNYHDPYFTFIYIRVVRLRARKYFSAICILFLSNDSKDIESNAGLQFVLLHLEVKASKRLGWVLGKTRLDACSMYWPPSATIPIPFYTFQQVLTNSSKLS